MSEEAQNSESKEMTKAIYVLTGAVEGMSKDLTHYMKQTDERIETQKSRTDRHSDHIFGGNGISGLKDSVAKLQFEEESRVEREKEEKENQKSNKTLIYGTLATASLGLIAWIWSLVVAWANSLKTPPH